MRIYLDACCLNRLTDDQTQNRIRQEAAAIERIIRCIVQQSIQWVSSEALIDEIERNSIAERRLSNRALLAVASETIAVDSAISNRAAGLHAIGYGAYDALHLACAEAGGVDVLLTTDDRFIRKASRRDGYPLIAVAKPVSWVKENLP